MKSIKLIPSRTLFILLLTSIAILSTTIVFAKVPQSVDNTSSTDQNLIELDHKESVDKTLLIRQVHDEDNHFHGGELILKSDREDQQTVIAQDILSADLSDDGLLIAIWNSDNKIKLYDSMGKEMKVIGTHGASPIISQDKNYIAYNKLSDKGSDLLELSEKSPYGIAVHNLATGREDVVTTSNHDFQPVGFSKDMTKLYFNSTRAFESTDSESGNHVASLWVVDLSTKKVTRLTNLNEELVMKGVMVPTLDVRALWSSDKKTAISSTDTESGIWKFEFNDDGTLLDAKKIASGTAPRWSELDNKIEISTKIGGQVISQELSIK